jgi:hypothetical protein
MAIFRYLSSAAVAAAVTSLGSPTLAQPIPGEGAVPTAAVAVVVKVPTPWYAPKFFVASKMRDTIPPYESLQGLNFKAFSFARADGHYGGIYLWKDVASARQWFTPEWFARVERERGASADVRFFEVAAVLVNPPDGARSDPDSAAVATIVEIPIPPGIGKDKVVEGLAASVSTFQRVPGLLRKYFITTPQGKFGGIYLWKDEASAKAWFTDAWSDRVRREYGQAATVEWFDTPILLVGKQGNGVRAEGAKQP